MLERFGARARQVTPSSRVVDVLRADAAELSAASRWFDAAERWFRLVRADPTDGAAHRELARMAGEVVVWGGAFSGENPPTFLSAAALAERHPGQPVAMDPLGVARRAIERATVLRPDSVAWLAPLAELREADGDLDGAIEAYERVVAESATSRSAWVVRSRHLWQFQLERAYHRRGDARVDDPLFAATLEPIAAPGTPSSLAVGVYRARFTHQGLNVGGLVADPDVQSVEVALDGTVLRRVNVGSEGPVRRFDMVLRRPVLDVAPTESRLTVATTDGRPLTTQAGAIAVEVRLPGAAGLLHDLLATGATVDKKGALTPTQQEAIARQDTLLRLYGKVRDAFGSTFGRDLFVLYGTLLGVHRQGELIAGDDDLDCGYVAAGHDPPAVKAEAIAFIEALVRMGFSVSINRRGRMFRVHHDAIGDATLHIDIHPVWFEGPDLYVHNHHRFPAEVTDLLPTQARDIRGGPVLVPHRPEALLERFYGPGWRTPDPGYVDDSSGADPDVMARLSEALLTPEEHRELAARLEDPALVRPAQGRLVFIATQSLYPLADFVE